MARYRAISNAPHPQLGHAACMFTASTETPLEQEPVRVALTGGAFACAIGRARPVLQEELAEAADLLGRRVEIAAGVEKLAEIGAHHVRGAEAGGEVAICGARFAGNVMRAAAVHLGIFVATAQFPTLHAFRFPSPPAYLVLTCQQELLHHNLFP